MNLQGVQFTDWVRYWWLERRRPVAKIGYSIFVYDVTGDADAHYQLALIYLRQSLQVLAASELRTVLAIDPGHDRAGRLLPLPQETAWP